MIDFPTVSSDFDDLAGLTFIITESTSSYSNRIPLIVTAPSELADLSQMTYPTECSQSGSDQFYIPSSGLDSLYIVDPAQAFHETKLSQNTYDVLITTGTQPSCTITKVSM